VILGRAENLAVWGFSYRLVSQHKMRTTLTALLTATAFGSGACSAGPSDAEIFTLYRNSVTDEKMRIHVATFDAAEKEEYNRGNCEQAQVLFQGQPGVKVKFWCEKGRYRK